MFLRSMDAACMATEEIKQLLGATQVFEHGPIVTCTIKDSSVSYIPRLALSKVSFEFLFQCEEVDVVDTIQNFDWKNMYEESFGVQCLGFEDDRNNKKWGGMIYDLIGEPKVDLKNPQTEIHFYKEGGVIFCGRVIHKLKGTLGEHNNKNRPHPHPSTISQKFARAMINLTGVSTGILCDPFCGGGGIVIEACSLGYTVMASDANEIMTRRCKENCSHYGYTPLVVHADATRTLQKSDCIVTDLPFGKNTMLSETLAQTYAKFFRLAQEKTNTIVAGYESSVDLKTLANGWTLVNEFEIYVHKSMTRKIALFQKT